MGSSHMFTTFLFRAKLNFPALLLRPDLHHETLTNKTLHTMRPGVNASGRLDAVLEGVQRLVRQYTCVCPHFCLHLPVMAIYASRPEVHNCNIVGKAESVDAERTVIHSRSKPG